MLWRHSTTSNIKSLLQCKSCFVNQEKPSRLLRGSLLSKVKILGHISLTFCLSLIKLTTCVSPYVFLFHVLAGWGSFWLKATGVQSLRLHRVARHSIDADELARLSCARPQPRLRDGPAIWLRHPYWGTTVSKHLISRSWMLLTILALRDASNMFWATDLLYF